MSKEAENYYEEYFSLAKKKYEHFYVLSRKRMDNYCIISYPKEENHLFLKDDYLKFNEDFNNIISKFIDIFKKNFCEEYLTNFKRNISDVNIINYKLTLFDKIKSTLNIKTEIAYYDFIHNNIYLSSNTSIDKAFFYEHVFFHELLHLASTKNIMSVGLCQQIYSKDGVKSIGKAVNEGMTEYLNTKYFSKNKTNKSKRKNHSYDLQINYIRKIESIIGKDKLLYCYFEGGLFSLIKELSKYAEDESLVLDLLIEMDDSFDLIGNSKMEKDRKIRKELFKIYNSKLKNDFLGGIINSDEYNRKKLIFLDENYSDISFSNENTNLKNNKKLLKTIS